MESKWIFWTYVPMFSWAGWIHAGIRARHTKYFVIAALYGIPFMLAMIFTEGNEKSGGGYSTTYNVVMSVNILAWAGGIVHAQAAKKGVNLRIKYAAKSATTGMSSSDGELERRIAAEYGVQVVPSTAPPVGQSIPPQINATATGGDLSFVEWYTMKFGWFVTQPMPWSIIVQLPLWLCYGFIWIPLWYAISDKRRIAVQPNQPAQQRIPQQPIQTPPFVHQPSVSRAAPPPATLSPTVPPHLPDASSNLSGVDLNNATEQDIAALPGIGPILAKKAIKSRTTHGGFESVEHFAQVLSLKPHVVEQIKSRVVIGPNNIQVPVVKKLGGRVVDF